MRWLLGRRKLSDLVTCIVQRRGDGWTATWAVPGQMLADFNAPSLADVIERGSREVRSLYEGSEILNEAELQFAIYPWGDGTGEVILDVHEAPFELTATDIQGSALTVGGSSADDLVRNAEATLPDKSKAMFRWIRAMRDLPQT